METNKSVFSANVVFKDGFDETIDVVIDKDDMSLTYDEVEYAIYDAVNKKHHFVDVDFEEDAPYHVSDIMILTDEGIYPVVPEDFDMKAIDNDKQYEKYLVLPYARYSLTPECKLWMKMKLDGIINENEEFDFDKMHELINTINV